MGLTLIELMLALVLSILLLDGLYSVFMFSEKIFQAIDCEGVVRVDFMVSQVEEKPYFLEVNTIPGMTETSLVPKAAAQAGISFEDLCEQILDGANLKYGTH